MSKTKLTRKIDCPSELFHTCVFGEVGMVISRERER